MVIPRLPGLTFLSVLDGHAFMGFRASAAQEPQLYSCSVYRATAKTFHMSDEKKGVSPRPLVTRDPWGFNIKDPTTGEVLGRAGPFGRRRLMSALRLGEWNSEWHSLRHPMVVVDPWRFAITDPTTGEQLGLAPIFVQRMLTARWTEDTRHWGG
jgi:hypothetical protein